MNPSAPQPASLSTEPGGTAQGLKPDHRRAPSATADPIIPAHQRTWGTPHRPLTRYRSEQASQYARDCMAALDFWIAAALTGGKRHRLESENQRGVLRPADSILADIAQVLAATPEWDGFLLAAALLARGWPADLALAHLLHAWSCGLRFRRIHASREGRSHSAA